MKLLKKIKSRIQDVTVGQNNKQSSMPIRYFSSGGNWSTHYDAQQIISNLPEPLGEITTSHLGINQGIFHYGGISHAINKKGKMKWPNEGVPCIVTWYHILDGDPRLRLIPKMDDRVALWHSTCQNTLDTLIQQGVNPSKTRLIPLGVDTNAFAPSTAEEKKAQRKAYAIPEDAFVIGSFQKDALGWKDGVKPKLEKGPDIFCSVVEALAKKHKIFIVLSGPARGYVKQRLDAANIPYTHTGYMETTEDIAALFSLLDMYLVGSRIEGGPKSILESMASGIPLVTTTVGMVRDILTHERNSLIAPIEDVGMLAQHCERLIEDPEFSQSMAKQANQDAQQYTWQQISQRYYDELYLPLLNLGP